MVGVTEKEIWLQGGGREVFLISTVSKIPPCFSSFTEGFGLFWHKQTPDTFKFMRQIDLHGKVWQWPDWADYHSGENKQNNTGNGSQVQYVSNSHSAPFLSVSVLLHLVLVWLVIQKPNGNIKQIHLQARIRLDVNPTNTQGILLSHYKKYKTV